MNHLSPSMLNKSFCEFNISGRRHRRSNMQTRGSYCISTPKGRIKRSIIHTRNESTKKTKRRRTATEETTDYFDSLPNDLIVSILCKLSSSAASPADLINFLITCKRMHELGQHPLVLHNASAKALAIKATNWSDSAHRFLDRCVDAGNLAACYALGMIQFYCLYNRGTGASLMATAAKGSHATALYSLAVIQFNGSGGSKDDKNLRAGVVLCSRAALLGHVDALRELGHCLQDGYGVRQNVAGGRRLLIQANARELAAAMATITAADWMTWKDHMGPGCPLLSDYGYELPPVEVEPVNRFMTEWFEERGGVEGLRVCSHGGCGRRETRRHEFRRCSVCGSVNYCSRACQAVHWKQVHKNQCVPMNGWVFDQPGAEGVPAPQPATVEER